MQKQEESSTKAEECSENENNSPSFECSEILSFEDMNLKEGLLRGIFAYGFEKPSAIQQKAILPFVQHYDLIAQAQSGTGKTATFSIALLQTINSSKDSLQGIVLSNSQELATQTFKVISSIGAYLDTRIVLCSGGTNVSESVREIATIKPHIVIGTPGRVLHLLDDGHLNARTIECLLLDEADALLSDKFQSQIRSIYSMLKCPSLQVGLYSATITQEMEQIIPRMMNDNHVRIRVNQDQLTLEGIQQYYVNCDRSETKFFVLEDIYESISVTQMIIYVNRKETAETIARKLNNSNLPSEFIHGQMDPQHRRDVMGRFRGGDVRVLISTDLLARGIDVQQVSMVINYDFPLSIETYLHRIGRSGRYGRKGIAINLITSKDVDNARRTEDFYQTQFVELPADLTSLSMK